MAKPYVVRETFYTHRMILVDGADSAEHAVHLATGGKGIDIAPPRRADFRATGKEVPANTAALLKKRLLQDAQARATAKRSGLKTASRGRSKSRIKR